ncbi:hypothetical protein [Thermococcus sp. MAR1]|nr:hypothetical protein [Thermococcus sp. MAR1]
MVVEKEMEGLSCGGVVSESIKVALILRDIQLMRKNWTRYKKSFLS